MHKNLFGPTVYDGGVTFRVYSPSAKKLRLLLSPETPYERKLEMPRVDSEFFELDVDGVSGGMRYRLQRDDRWPQADPASQFQPDGVFGPSEIIDHRCYRWQNESWRGLSLEDVVLYELHVGTFSHTRDYDGVRRRLSHLRDCGITAIKLMPLATFAGRQNWGYDGVFHMAPFAAYGRPDQLRRLIDEAHGHGIAVLLDVVSNHFGPEGNPMWDMARPFFCERGNTAWGPGPRFERATVMAYFDEMARLFRREYRFDGLRVDAVDAIPIEHRKQHIVQLRDAIEDSGPKDGHSILMLELFDSQHDVLRHRAPGCSVTQLNTEFQRAGHRLLTGEGHNEYSDFVAPDRDFQSCLADGFAFFDRKSDFIGKVVGQPLDALPWPTIVNYLVNHDTCGNRYLGQRLQALIGDRAFRAAHALLILQPGMPYLFMGQEWATKGRYHFFTDFEQGLGRRVARGRKRGFHELGAGGIDGCEQKAPAPQQRQALESSTLDWSELEQSPHREMAAFTKTLLALRARIEYPPTTADTSCCMLADRTFCIEIPQTDHALYLVANLSDDGCEIGQLSVEEILFCSEHEAYQPLASEHLLQKWCCSLLKARR